MQDMINKINEYFSYDPESGIVRWIVSKGKAKSGDIAGTKNHHGYIVVGFMGKERPAHKIAYYITHGIYPDVVDHINGVKDDNRIINLRAATHLENSRNRKVSLKNSSGIKGIYEKKDKFRRKPWAAEIMFNGSKIWLGLFGTKEDAKDAYNKKAIELFGEFHRE